MRDWLNIPSNERLIKHPLRWETDWTSPQMGDWLNIPSNRRLNMPSNKRLIEQSLKWETDWTSPQMSRSLLHLFTSHHIQLCGLWHWKLNLKVPRATKGAGAYDRRAGAYDRRAGTYDRRAGAYDRRAGAYDRRAGTYGRRAGAYDRRAGTYDRRAGAYDRSWDNLRMRITFYAEGAHFSLRRLALPWITLTILILILKYMLLHPVVWLSAVE